MNVQLLRVGEHCQQMKVQLIGESITMASNKGFMLTVVTHIYLCTYSGHQEGFVPTEQHHGNQNVKHQACLFNEWDVYTYTCFPLEGWVWMRLISW